jgi:TetR/AcrR family transcriptional regulator, lmrAB and yxaGH operons repressor
MEERGTRERLIRAMGEALQRCGMNGIGLTELLAAAQAPKGVLYHHFPGGKTELTVATIHFTAERMLARLDRLLGSEADPITALTTWMGAAQARLGDSGFETGCPLATVALETTATDTELRDALAAAFGAIRARLAEALVRSGQPKATADGLAALIVSAYEGGLLQARVERSLEPMLSAVHALVALLEAQRVRPVTSPPVRKRARAQAPAPAPAPTPTPAPASVPAPTRARQSGDRSAPPAAPRRKPREPR